MKADTHPTWHDDTTVTCACGNSFVTGSTKKVIVADICSNCHPFFTGEMRFVDTQGRVEKFQAKQDAAKKIQFTKKEKTRKKEERPETLREMLLSEKKRLDDESKKT